MEVPEPPFPPLFFVLFITIKIVIELDSSRLKHSNKIPGLYVIEQIRNVFVNLPPMTMEENTLTFTRVS